MAFVIHVMAEWKTERNDRFGGKSGPSGERENTNS